MPNEKPKRKAKKKVVGYKTVTTSKGGVGKGKLESTPPSRTPAERVYKPADERTGAPSYGKESMTKPTPEFVKNAQDKKQEIVEKDGKKYRAGYTDLKSGEIQSGSTKFTAGKIEMPQTKQIPIYEKVADKKGAKLKARAMTYGGSDKNDRGVTRHVRRATKRVVGKAKH